MLQAWLSDNPSTI